jgi:hypothetical protein
MVPQPAVEDALLLNFLHPIRFLFSLVADAVRILTASRALVMKISSMRAARRAGRPGEASGTLGWKWVLTDGVDCLSGQIEGVGPLGAAGPRPGLGRVGHSDIGPKRLWGNRACGFPARNPPNQLDLGSPAWDLPTQSARYGTKPEWGVRPADL